MAKDRYPEITESLRSAVEQLDMDGLLYRLTQLAVSLRDEAAKGSSNSEQRYWQQMVVFLSDATERCSSISGAD